VGLLRFLNKRFSRKVALPSLGSVRFVSGSVESKYRSTFIVQQLTEPLTRSSVIVQLRVSVQGRS
jgi:hypothetical protein